MARTYFALAGVMGFLGVALGAFGAHGLKKRLASLPDGEQRTAWWQTGAMYHLVLGEPLPHDAHGKTRARRDHPRRRCAHARGVDRDRHERA
jgi:hypothetical protein